MDEAIIRYVRRKHQLIIGNANAERIKIEAGTAVLQPNGRAAEIRIRGRDLRQGKPKTAVLAPHDIAEALESPIEEIAEFIQRAIEDLPPEVSSDVCDRGISLSGGGALLDKLDVELERRIGVKFIIPENPMHCVVKGTALVLQTLGEREHLLIKP
jgi:rod shape-determining protein MreB